MSTSRISIKEIHEHTAQLPNTQKRDTSSLESSMKWEDKLLGRKFIVVNDHKDLEYFKTQPNLSLRQTRWWEYLSRFNYDTIHVDGTRNQVACHATMNTILLRMNTPIANSSKQTKYLIRMET